MKKIMSQAAQGYFVLSVTAILIFLLSFKATMYFGDLISRNIF